MDRMDEEISGMKNRKSAASLVPTLSDAATAAKKPQLGPEIQAKIGQQLGRIYDDMLNQGVPNRFLILLDRLNQPKKSDQEPR
jgi:anti-sigma factor NepR-like protein